MVEADLARYEVSVGDELGDDLSRVAAAVLPFRGAPGFRAGAGSVVRFADTLRFLAVDAWLSNSSGYARARGQYRLHIDKDGQARLLPVDLSGILLDDGELTPSGSVLLDACRADVDQDCLVPLRALVEQIGELVVDLNLAAVVDGVETALGAAADDAAFLDLRTRLSARPVEVALRLVSP